MRFLLKNPENQRRFIIFIGDILVLSAAAHIVIMLFNTLDSGHTFGLLKRPIKFYQFYISVCVYLITLYVFEMYNIHHRHGRSQIFASLILVASVAFLVVFSLAKVIKINKTTMVYVSLLFFLSIPILYAWRRIFLRIFLNSEYFIKKIIFLGEDCLTEEILDEIRSFDYRVVGLFGGYSSRINSVGHRLNIYGSDQDLCDFMRSHNIKILITDTAKPLPLDIMKKIYRLKFMGVEVYDSAYFYEIVTRKLPIKHYLVNNCIPYLSLDTFVSPFFKVMKRFFDLLFSASFLIVLSPLFFLICVLVIVFSGFPVFYLQERIGFQERTFKLIKFRTMKIGAEDSVGPQWSFQGDARVTGIGKFLRSTRLDELPQLINIIKGDMSFVGPRPIRRYFAMIVEEKIPFYSLRFTIKPGLTGWAQVHYEYGGSIEGHIKKLQYDLYYVKHASVFLDLFITLKTLQTIIRRPGY